MKFLKKFLVNLLVLLVLFVLMYLFDPDIFGMVYETIGQLFGPLVILMIIVAALPGRRSGS